MDRVSDHAFTLTVHVVMNYGLTCFNIDHLTFYCCGPEWWAAQGLPYGAPWTEDEYCPYVCVGWKDLAPFIYDPNTRGRRGIR